MQKNLEDVVKNLKEADRAAVKGVIQYFLDFGLHVEIRGSVAKGKKGYHDVDLLVRGEKDKMNTADIFGLLYKKALEKYTQHLLTARKNLDLRMKKPSFILRENVYRILSYQDQSGAYVDVPIQRRMVLESGPTIIDVSMKHVMG